MSKHKLILTDTVDRKIKDYVDLIDKEIGMFGYVTLTDSGDFLVDEVFLVKQTVTGSTVDFTDEGLAYAINKAAEDDRLEDLKFCCHSHVNMGAFWSSTDEKMIAGMNTGLTPYLVSMVTDKKRDTECRVDYFPKDGELSKFTPQITFTLDLEVQREYPAEIEAEIQKLVKIERPVGYSWSGKGKDKSAKQAKDWPTDEQGWFEYWESREKDDLDQLAWGDDPYFKSAPQLNAAGDVTGYMEIDEMSDEDFEKLMQEVGA